jgi:uncharacterized protein YaeQ
VRLRCDLHVNDGARKLILVCGPTETEEHLALRLCATLLFWDEDPLTEASLKHPALMDQEFLPDLMALDAGGAVRLWVECGKAALHKLGKLVSRYPGARLVVLKASEREGERFRAELADEIERHARIEILAWPAGDFKAFLGALRGGKAEVYGSASPAALNLILNETPFAVDMRPF